MSRANCPNCGGPFEHGVCPYCGTVDETALHIKHGTPVKIAYEFGGREYEMKVVISNFTIERELGSMLYADGLPSMGLWNTKVSLEGDVVSEDGVEMLIREEKGC